MTDSSSSLDLLPPGALGASAVAGTEDEPFAAVVALSPTWRVGGETVIPGKVYRVPSDVATGLIVRGKAQPA